MKSLFPYSSYLGKSNEKNVLVHRIQGYLERHYDQKISIPELCNLFGISSRHLNRLFKQATGQTVVEVVHKIRIGIERAKYLLCDPSEKVTNVAMKVGYDDSAFFSRLFRRFVGCSPGKYKSEILTNVCSK
ncbi:AraC family transcriptional regulator [Fictibacillus terranigra]|uniref:AraC family transcriptional regulator n=1 Tax=Fictibacillus terranigra TaxID=3058424 RepID=UPI00338ED78D